MQTQMLTACNTTHATDLAVTNHVRLGLHRPSLARQITQERTDYSWVVRWWDKSGRVSPWSTPAEFHFAPRAANFTPGWIGDGSTAASQQGLNNLFRTSFTVPSDIAKATLYVCGLGYSYAYVNGVPAGPNLLTTAPWTNNERRSGFSTFDVTNSIKKGGVYHLRKDRLHTTTHALMFGHNRQCS